MPPCYSKKLFSHILLAHSNTCILVGLRTSKVADALKERVAKGLDNVVEFTMVRSLVSIVWRISFTSKKGEVPAARSGNNSENAVYLISWKANCVSKSGSLLDKHNDKSNKLHQF